MGASPGLGTAGSPAGRCPLQQPRRLQVIIVSGHNAAGRMIPLYQRGRAGGLWSRKARVCVCVCTVSARCSKGLKSFSLKFKFQQALPLPSRSFERLTGNHFAFHSEQNKLN